LVLREIARTTDQAVGLGSHPGFQGLRVNRHRAEG